MSKSAALRTILNSPEMEFLMEAHNGISARIVETAGFRGIWASGLSISAQFGVRDNNEASWSQVVDMLEFMSDATEIPILLDGDTGYGNFNNMRRLVRKLEQRAIAGVCIEDKLFPKTNSFIGGDQQPLADIDEFCGKIKAGKDSQTDEAFCIVARVEALIAGLGMDEALKRAEAYQCAGADAILIHSALSQPDEILTFAREWAGRGPLVIVPTRYYSAPTELFRQAGVSLVIWANHLLRAAVSRMQQVAAEIARTQTLIHVEDSIAPVSEIFRLQGADELLDAERRYVQSALPRMGAIVLAATRGGSGLEALTEDRPKVMLPVAGKPLLRRLVQEFKSNGVRDITVVAGYKAEAIDACGIRIVTNPRHDTSGEIASLLHAREFLKPDTIVLYGDLLFRSYIVRDLLDAPGEVVVVVDSDFDHGQRRDLAWCTTPDTRTLFRQDVNLLKVAATGSEDAAGASGRWTGMVRLREQGAAWFNEALAAFEKRTDVDRLGMPELLNRLVADGRPVKVMYIHGHWLDVNNLEDLRRAGEFACGA